MLEFLNKYNNKKKEYLINYFTELHYLSYYKELNDSMIIDVDEFSDVMKFIDNCKYEIDCRKNIINNNSIYSFDECKEHIILDISKLKCIIIYCGIDNYDLQELLLDYMMCFYDIDVWKYRFGIILIRDF